MATAESIKRVYTYFYNYVCIQCGAAFVSTQHRKKCCSPECLSQRKKTVLRKLRKCEICGQTFRKKSGGAGLCCSRPCGFAYMAWQGLLSRQRTAQKIQQRQKGTLRLCSICHGEFRSVRGSLVCGPECKDARYRVGIRAICESRPGYKAPKPCVVCGVVFTPAWKGLRRFCSWRCSRKQKRAKRPRDKKHTERARRYGVPRAYNIKPFDVFQRDKWRCQICGFKIQKRLFRKQCEDAPSIDHIVPLSVSDSPGHVWTNVQTAHRRCNTQKSTRALGQPGLF